jgi:transaldolase
VVVTASWQVALGGYGLVRITINGDLMKLAYKNQTMKEVKPDPTNRLRELLSQLVRRVHELEARVDELENRGLWRRFLTFWKKLFRGKK